MKLIHVRLECPYDSWNDPTTKSFFCDAMGLRLSGYLQEYRYGVMPFDTSDFVATHYLICRKEGKRLIPLIGSKSLSLERCQIHDLTFPVLGALKTIHAPEHASVVQEIVTQYSSSPAYLFYNGGLTMDPLVRKDRVLAGELLKNIKAAWMWHQLSSNVQEDLCFAAVRFKVDRLLGELGYQKIEAQGIPLPPVSMPTLMNGHEAAILHRKGFAPMALQIVDEYKSQCEATIVVNSRTVKEKAA